jgi:hypothetical protein
VSKDKQPWDVVGPDIREAIREATESPTAPALSHPAKMSVSRETLGDYLDDLVEWRMTRSRGAALDRLAEIFRVHGVEVTDA